jgi:chromosomal replication initiator protein
MHGISLRLRTRLEWGLVTDIGIPNLETRIAILEKKAEQSGTQVSQDVLSFVASHAPHNVRQLEGIFIRVMAFASLTGQELTKELAEKVLGRPPAASEPQKVTIITLEMIAQAIEKECGYTLNQLRSPSRHKGMSLARQFAMYLMKKETGQPLTAIAQYLRRSDHTTILYGVQKIEQLLTQDLKSRELIERIESTLKQTQL